MKTLIVLMAAGALLAGCNCETPFKEGELVKHRLVERWSRGLVLRAAGTKNYEGFCLVDVRWESGIYGQVTVDELEKLP